MKSANAVEMRQHILDTARPIMLSKGFSAVGLNEILSAAGIPKGSFYHYFESKEAFGGALLESYFSAYLERMDELFVRPGGTAAERLMSYWEDWRDDQESDDIACKCLVVKLGAEVCDLSEPMRAVLQEGTERIVARIAGCIEAGVADGSLKDFDDPHRTAATLYELWLGATLLDKIGYNRQPLDAAMAATRIILNLPGPL
ncbi:TetR/AcrR family transcriptional regulator [Trinickia violacea]|uniref:TetR/AcrR family transcriptional regulator n=1 Tax=Trinickia violacea TaxID=2571746 RepID=A0A4P8IRH9_9BURK|nr:TetR/AcrR family transcriptional regulator [Trinickia violacea]QCP49564.1 TetR/AcrR family transcriptional regulator [Trinickia violacea]